MGKKIKILHSSTLTSDEKPGFVMRQNLITLLPTWQGKTNKWDHMTGAEFPVFPTSGSGSFFVRYKWHVQSLAQFNVTKTITIPRHQIGSKPKLCCQY